MTTHVRAGGDIPPRSTLDSVPVRLGTQTGLGTALLMFILSGIDAIAGERIDADTRMLVALGVASVIATVLSRGYQAARLYAAQKTGINLPDQPLR